MVRDGRWREGRPELLKTPRLMGQTLGMIAFGHVARAVAMRAKGFGLRMIAYDPFIEELVMPYYDVHPATLEDVLRNSDFVSMHAPATPEAKGMLKEKHFRMMKPTAWFINTGRGPTVDESALITALQQGWIAGAGLDVLEQEPPRQDNPILQMKNVICPPYRVGLRAVRPGAQAARWKGVGAGAERSLADELRQSVVLAKSSLIRWQPYSMERGPNS